MEQVFSAYPAGFEGAGLLLLRGSAAVFLVTALPCRWAAPSWAGLIFAAVAVAVMLGVFTRSAASLCAAVAVTTLAGAGMRGLPGLPQLLDAAALAMIGPGAFSIDARWFGRRTIHLSD